MRKLLLLCTLFLFYSCSSQDVVEKNIETHMSTHLSEYEILSAEYSRLYISAIDNLDDTQKDLLTDEERITLVQGHLLRVAKGLNRHMFNWVISNDRLAAEKNLEATTYFKLGFFELKNRGNDVFPAAFGFIIDTTYNVERVLMIDDVNDYKYIYNRAFDKKQR